MASCVRNLCYKHLKYFSHAGHASRLAFIRTFSTSGSGIELLSLCRGLEFHSKPLQRKSSVEQNKPYIFRLAGIRSVSTGSSGEQGKPDIFRRVLDSFPSVQMAFAYGSGVFQQTGHEMSQNMLDFIFVVDNPVQWHTENIARHKHHYSFLAMFGPKTVASIQENYGAGVYFNTLVPFENRLIKYGIISKSRLVTDLTDWDTLYLSGRLHKPVRLVQQPSCESVAMAMVTNYRSAVHAALLLLPQEFTEEELFMQITRLSYDGDFRMKFGEDKGKVRKIVTPNIDHFCNLYKPIIAQEADHVTWNHGSGKLEQSLSSDTRLHHLTLLPKHVRSGILKSVKFMAMTQDESGSEAGSDSVLDMVSQLGNCPDIVGESVAGIVRSSSWGQSLKGLATAGISKSIKYSSKKVMKMLKGLKDK